MARPLRVDVQGGWYHVTARGTERRTLFQDKRDHAHFLDLLEEMSERYGVEVHAYALMGNHYHLLLRTPSANASAALQWVNVSYSVWFNKKRERVGHVFQGRFASVLIDGAGSWVLNASVYVHLNPVRTSALGLDKAANRAECQGLRPPNRADLKRRLKVLREFPWCSFRAYAGYAPTPPWLKTEELLRRAGGRSAYRRYVQRHVTRGLTPEGFEGLKGRLALGTHEFGVKVREWVKRVSPEQPARRQLTSTAPVASIVKRVEQKRGQSWEEFAQRHGDWGRELVLYLARKRSGLTLRQIAEALGEPHYKTVGKAVQRFEASLAHDLTRREVTQECLDELSLVET